MASVMSEIVIRITAQRDKKFDAAINGIRQELRGLSGDLKGFSTQSGTAFSKANTLMMSAAANCERYRQNIIGAAMGQSMFNQQLKNTSLLASRASAASVVKPPVASSGGGRSSSGRTSFDDGGLNALLRGAKQDIQRDTGEIIKLTEQGTVAMAAWAAGSSILVKSLVDTASKYEQYRATLVAVTHDQVEANRLMQQAITLAPRTPFTVGEITKSLVYMKAMGVETDRTMQAALNLASAFGTDLNHATQALAKASQGSAYGFTILRNTYGITAKDLSRYGAVTKSGTQMIYAQTGAIDKNREALLKLIQARYGDAINQQMGTAKTAFSNVSDEVEKLAAAMGQTLLPAATGTAKAISGAIGFLNNAPKPLMELAAWSTAAASGIATLGAGALGLGVVLFKVWRTFDAVTMGAWGAANALKATAIGVKMLDLANSTMVVGMAKFAGALGMIGVGVVAGLAAYKAGEAGLLSLYHATEKAEGGFGKFLNTWSKGQLEKGSTAYWEEFTKKTEEAVKRDEKALAAARTYVRQYANHTAAELNKAGVSSKQLGDDISSMIASAKAAYKQGDTAQGRFYMNLVQKAMESKKSLEELETQLKNTITALQDMSVEFDIYKGSDAFATAAQEVQYLIPKIVEAQDAARKLGVITGHDIGFNFDFTNLEQAQYKLRSLQLVQEQYKKAANDPEGSEEEKKRAKEQADAIGVVVKFMKAATDASKKDREDDLADRKRWIERAKDMNQLNLQHEQDAWQRIADAARDGSQEQKEALQKVVDLKRQMVKESQKLNAEALQKELDTIKAMEGSQVAAYDKLLKKIQEYGQAKKISATDTYQLTNKTKGSQRAANDKEEKDRYDRMVNIQEQYLAEVDKNEELSVGKRIGYYQSLIRYWEDQERKGVVTSKQAADQKVAITKKMIDAQADIVKANKEADKEIRGQMQDSLNYEISKMAEKMEAGEDMERKIRERIELRHALEMQSMDEEIKKMQDKGWTEDRIQKEIALMRLKSGRDQLQTYDDIIARVERLKQEEEKGSKPGRTMDLGEYLDHMSSLMHDDKKTSTLPDVSGLKSDRDRLSRQIQQDERTVLDMTRSQTGGAGQQGAAGPPGSGTGIITGAAAAFNVPVSSFSSAVDRFSQAANILAGVQSRGVSVPQGQYQAVVASRSSGTGVNAGSSPGMGGVSSQSAQVVNHYHNNINVTVEGSKVSGNSGVTVTNTGDKTRLEFPQSLMDMKNRANRPIGY